MPGNNDTKSDKGAESRPESGGIRAPSISLPKGGGAIHGLGEKFGAKPGSPATGSMTVQIATSPRTVRFGPQLSLSYDSGSGTGPSASAGALLLLPLHARPTRGFPQYRDAEESDVFILSGAKTGPGSGRTRRRMGARGFFRRAGSTVSTIASNATARESKGLFARIERWTNQTDPSDSLVLDRSICSSPATDHLYVVRYDMVPGRRASSTDRQRE